MTEVPVEEPEVERASLSEYERIVRWRTAVLEHAGYEALAVIQLASRTDIDLHLATDLTRRGCPPETALRILL